jgi:hypothetical protein
MFGEVEQTEEEAVKACADAYFLALFGGYQRAPSLMDIHEMTGILRVHG